VRSNLFYVEEIPKEARAYTEANLPIEWKDLYPMFKEVEMKAGKVTSPRFDLHEPFVVVPKGLSVLDMDKGLEARYNTRENPRAFKDASRSGSLNKTVPSSFNTERESSGLLTGYDMVVKVILSTSTLLLVRWLILLQR